MSNAHVVFYVSIHRVIFAQKGGLLSLGEERKWETRVLITPTVPIPSRAAGNDLPALGENAGGDIAEE